MCLLLNHCICCALQIAHWSNAVLRQKHPLANMSRSEPLWEGFAIAVDVKVPSCPPAPHPVLLTLHGFTAFAAFHCSSSGTGL